MTPQPESKTESSQRVPGTLGSFAISGIPIRFHFTFLLLAIWLIYVGASGKQSGWATAVYVFALFGSVLLHELGHALVARRYGIKTLEIVMLPFGGVARLASQPSPTAEFWVALAGPMVNLLIGAALLAVTMGSGVMPSPSHWFQSSDGNLISRIAVANLVLALFNLIPAFPMDGGRILRSILASRRPIEEATRIAARVGIAFAAILGLYGLLSFNFFLVFIAFFVYVGAMQESLATTQQALIRGALVRDAMITDFRTLEHSNTIRQAADLLLATSQQDFPVLSGNSVSGLLNRSDLMRALAVEGPESYVAGAMQREFISLSPVMDLTEAVAELKPHACALVFDDDRLIGMLTSENLSEFLMLRQIGRVRRKFEANA